MISIKRLTSTIVDLPVAVRYWEIIAQLTDVSHVTHQEIMRYLYETEEKGIWVFGLFEEDLLVSTLSLHFMFHPWGIESRVQNVVTDEPYRDKGYGGILLQHAVAVLPEIHSIGREFKGIYKQTLAARPDAETFYAKRGFLVDEQEYKRLIVRDMFLIS